MSIQEKLKRVLRSYRLTEVARAAGVNYRTIFSVMEGKHAPTIGTIRAICDAIGVDYLWAIDDTKGWPPIRTLPGLDRVEHVDVAAA